MSSGQKIDCAYTHVTHDTDLWFGEKSANDCEDSASQKPTSSFEMKTGQKFHTSIIYLKVCI